MADLVYKATQFISIVFSFKTFSRIVAVKYDIFLIGGVNAVYFYTQQIF